MTSCESHEDEIDANGYSSSSDGEESIENDGSSSMGGDDDDDDDDEDEDEEDEEDEVGSKPRSSTGAGDEAWEALERSVASNPVDLGQSSIHRRLASAAAEYLIGNRGAKASAIAHSAVSALVALGVESTEAGRAVASAAWESGKEKSGKERAGDSAGLSRRRGGARGMGSGDGRGEHRTGRAVRVCRSDHVRTVGGLVVRIVLASSRG